MEILVLYPPTRRKRAAAACLRVAVGAFLFLRKSVGIALGFVALVAFAIVAFVVALALLIWPRPSAS